MRQRPEQQLRREADCHHGRHRAVAVGERGPRRARPESPRDQGEGDRPPAQRGGHRPGRERLGRSLPGRRDQGASPPAQPRGIPRQAREGSGSGPERGADGEHGQCGEQHGEGLAGETLGAVVHPGAQHRRPQGDERSGHGEPDPAEHHDHRVGHEHRAVPLVVEPTRQPRAEGRADGQARRCREVVAHGDPEPAGEGVPQPTPQLDAVPRHRARDRRRSHHRDGPPAGRHPDEHRADSREEHGDPAVLRRPVVDRLRGLEQCLGEVGAPHHRRVGQGTEEHEVHEEPPRRGNQRVHQGERGGEPEPDQARAVTQWPGAARRSGRRAVHGGAPAGRLRTARAVGRGPHGAHPTVSWLRGAGAEGRRSAPPRAGGAAGRARCRSRRPRPAPVAR